MIPRLGLLGLVWLAGCAGLVPEDTPKQFLPRQVLVVLSEERRAQWPAIDRDIQLRYGISRAGEFPLTSIRANCLVYRIPEPRYPEPPPEPPSPERLILELRQDPRIQLVQPNQSFEVLGSGADPYAALEYGPRAIGAELAFKVSTGKNVPVAVIDTGADPDHPDLKGRIIATRNFVDGGDASFAGDPHGTAVAGVIAARANDGIGIYGIAPESAVAVLKACWYPDPAKAKARCASWTLAKAIDFALNSGSRVINLSLSGPADALLEKLLDEAFRKGVTVVAAAAEDKPEPGFPAALPKVIPVISSDVQGRTARPSWLAQLAPLAAPGIDILTTAPAQGYDFLSGSSLASAHVTGVSALLLQLRPRLTPAEVRRILFGTGRSGPATRVDACRALKALAEELACP